MDLARKILLTVRDLPAHGMLYAGEVKGYEDCADDVRYHIDMLRQEGLLSAGTRDAVRADAITWEGNDFLKGIESDEAWERVKRWVASKGTALTLVAMKAPVAAFMQDALK